MIRLLGCTACFFALGLSLSFGCDTRPRVRPRPAPASIGVGVAVADGGAGIIDPNSVFCAPPVVGGMPFVPVSPFPPRVGPTVSQRRAPPAISGGTLRVLKDGLVALAADPDRDRVYIVDLARRTLKFPAVELQPADEPGRVVEDAAGRVHVALRGGGALVTISPVTGAVLARRSVCAAPRGVAHDPATDLVHVACATGELVSLPAAGGAPVRILKLGGDLRDVVIDAGKLRVSRFRSAQVLTVEADGSVSKEVEPPSFQSPRARQQQLFSPSVAWRTVGLPSGGVAMLHQRGLAEPIRPIGSGYYGSTESCDTLVHAAVTIVEPGAAPKSGPALAGLVLAVDMAVSPDGKRLAIVSAGNSTNAETEDGSPVLPRLFVTDLASATDEQVGCQHDGTHGPCMRPAFSGTLLIPFIEDDPEADGGVQVQTAALSSDPGAAGPADADATPPLCDPSGMPVQDPALPQVVGQPIAVAWGGDGQVIVQSREPAMLLLPGGVQIQLSPDSRQDTGLALFHANAGAFVACASCHPEGNDDGRVWNFPCDGARRTQSLQTGIAGTEPFHWDGHEKNFSQLIEDVFMLRMSGPMMTPEQVGAMLNWIDAQPRVGKTAAEDPAIQRGRALFTEPAPAGCATCHTGARFTNNQTVDVGTGGAFQVPSLVGLASHPPYLHDGCAATLRDRFGACGGGDRHGVTSKFSATEITDLVAFLETL